MQIETVVAAVRCTAGVAAVAGDEVVGGGAAAAVAVALTLQRRIIVCILLVVSERMGGVKGQVRDNRPIVHTHCSIHQRRLRIIRRVQRR